MFQTVLFQVETRIMMTVKRKKRTEIVTPRNEWMTGFVVIVARSGIIRYAYWGNGHTTNQQAIMKKQNGFAASFSCIYVFISRIYLL